MKWGEWEGGSKREGGRSRYILQAPTHSPTPQVLLSFSVHAQYNKPKRTIATDAQTVKQRKRWRNVFTEAWPNCTSILSLPTFAPASHLHWYRLADTPTPPQWSWSVLQKIHTSIPSTLMQIHCHPPPHPTPKCFTWSFLQKMWASSCWKRRTRVSPERAPDSSLRCSTPKSAMRSGSSRQDRGRWSNMRLETSAINMGVTRDEHENTAANTLLYNLCNGDTPTHQNI